MMSPVTAPPLLSESRERLSVGFHLVDLPKLSQSQAAMTAATRAGLILQERGWMRFSAVSWDKPAIIAMTAVDVCVAGINFTEDLDVLSIGVDFAWASPEYPAALVAVLARFRAKYRDSNFETIRFTCHDGNEPMAKAVRVFGLSPVSYSYRMPVSALSPKAKDNG